MIIDFIVAITGIIISFLYYYKDKYENKKKHKKAKKWISITILIITLLIIIINQFFSPPQPTIGHQETILKKIDSILIPSKEQIRNELETEFHLVKTKANNLYEKAMTETHLSNYHTSNKYLKEALSIVSISSFYTLMGSNYILMNYPDKSIFPFKKAIKLNENNHMAWSNLCSVYSILGELEKAISCSKQLKDYPDIQSLAFYNIAYGFYKKNNPEIAIKYYIKSIELNQSKGVIFKSSLSHLSAIFANKKDFNKAIYYQRKITEIDTTYIDAWKNLKLFYEISNNQRGLAESLNKIYKLDSFDYQNISDISEFYLSTKEIENAKFYINKLKDNDSIKYLYLKNMGALKYHQLELDSSINYLKKSLTIRPDQNEVLNTLAIELSMKERKMLKVEYFIIQDSFLIDIKNDTIGLLHTQREIEKHLKKSLKLKPNQHKIWAFLGDTYYRHSNYVESENCFLKATDINPNNIIALQGLGNIKLVTGKYLDAINYYKKVLTIDPSNNSSWKNIGKSYYYLREYQKALDSYLLVDIDKDYSLYALIAGVYLKLGYPSKAIEFSDKCEIKKIEDPELLLNLSSNYYKSNQAEKGQEYFEKAYFICYSKPSLLYKLHPDIREMMRTEIELQKKQLKSIN
tara:strand:- start:7803 stop:9701 length:1899 start_codon:yes stop_codon:yes gene_type:complete